MRLFKRSKVVLPTAPTNYPKGSFVHTEKGNFYIFDSSKRLKIISNRVLNSWKPLRIIETTEAAVANFRVSSKLGFRTGSLVTNISDGKMYLIEGSKKRHITSPEALSMIGATVDDFVSVSFAEIKLHEDGIPLA